MAILRFMLMVSIKYVSALFYAFDDKWFYQSKNFGRWEQLKLMVLLNHTSLFEPIFLRVAPISLIWQLSNRLIVPGADITLERPILGKFFKSFMPGIIPITRENDDSWRRFLNMISPSSLVAILPEGRMKRTTGLDKHGKPMSVRGGVADILQKQSQGKMLFVYSGGLHHVQAPGQRLPRLFKRIRVNIELVDIAAYKKKCGIEQLGSFKRRVIADMEERMRRFVPDKKEN